MQAHPIPQNVVSFEDKIFGPLTAKQFSIIAGGLSLAFVLYMSPLPQNLKIPVVGFVSMVSVAAGLVKINGMTLDTWLITFFSAIYSPTQFIWEKEPALSFLNFAPTITKTKVKTKVDKRRRELYPGMFEENLEDEKENQFLASLNFNLQSPLLENIPQSQPQPQLQIPQMEQPPIQTSFKQAPLPDNLDLEPSLMENTQTASSMTTQKPIPVQQTPIQQPIPKPKVIIEEKEVYPVKKEEFVNPKGAAKVALASNINFTNNPVFTLNISGQEPRYLEGLSNLKINRAIKKFDTTKQIFPIKGEKKFDISPELQKRFTDDDLEVKKIEVLNIESDTNTKPTPIKATVTIPKKTLEEPIKPVLNEKDKTVVVKGFSDPNEVKPLPQIKPTPIEKLPPLPVLSINNKNASIPPTFNFKSKEFEAPQIPNIIAGIVRNTEGATLHQVIIIIKNDVGTPVRALKTNKLGQFSIATPLPDNHYTIEFEKEGCKFNTIDLELKGEVIPIIDIRSIS